MVLEMMLYLLHQSWHVISLMGEVSPCIHDRSQLFHSPHWGNIYIFCQRDNRLHGGGLYSDLLTSAMILCGDSIRSEAGLSMLVYLGGDIQWFLFVRAAVPIANIKLEG